MAQPFWPSSGIFFRLFALIATQRTWIRWLALFVWSHTISARICRAHLINGTAVMIIINMAHSIISANDCEKLLIGFTFLLNLRLQPGAAEVAARLVRCVSTVKYIISPVPLIAKQKHGNIIIMCMCIINTIAVQQQVSRSPSADDPSSATWNRITNARVPANASI